MEKITGQLTVFFDDPFWVGGWIWVYQFLLFLLFQFLLSNLTRLLFLTWFLVIAYSVFENLIRKNADNHNTDLEKYIESYQFLKEKNIISLSELKESIVTLRDKNYKTTRAIKDTEKKIDGKVQLIDQAEKYLKHKDTYKAYTKLKKNKQDTFYNEHTTELILFESDKK